MRTYTYEQVVNPQFTNANDRARWDTIIRTLQQSAGNGFTSSLGINQTAFQPTIGLVAPSDTPYLEMITRRPATEGGAAKKIKLVSRLGLAPTDTSTKFDNAGPSMKTQVLQYINTYAAQKLQDDVYYDARILVEGLIPLLDELSAQEMYVESKNSQALKLFWGQNIPLPSAQAPAGVTFSSTGGTITNTSGGPLNFVVWLAYKTGEGYWFGYSDQIPGADPSQGMRSNHAVSMVGSVVVPNGTTTGSISFNIPYVRGGECADAYLDGGDGNAYYYGSTTGASYTITANPAVSALTVAALNAAPDASANPLSANGLNAIACNSLDVNGNLVTYGSGGSTPTGATIVDMAGAVFTGSEGTILEFDNPMDSVQALLKAPITHFTGNFTMMRSIANLMRRTANFQTIVVEDGKHSDKIVINTYQNKSIMQAEPLTMLSDTQMIPGQAMMDYHTWPKTGLDGPPVYLAVLEPWTKYSQDGYLDNTVDGKGQRRVTQLSAKEAPVNQIPAGVIWAKRAGIAA